VSEPPFGAVESEPPPLPPQPVLDDQPPAKSVCTGQVHTCHKVIIFLQPCPARKSADA